VLGSPCRSANSAFVHERNLLALSISECAEQYACRSGGLEIAELYEGGKKSD